MNKKIVLFLILLATVSFAQSPTPNIATSAVCTHSAGGSGVYAPANYNDGIIAPQGSLPWGWTTASSGINPTRWIQFEWPTAQTFGEITYYHAEIDRRYLTGATIQYWNGSVFVDHYTYVNPAPYTNWVVGVQFPPITTTRMRIGNLNIAPVGFASNPNFREIEIRNICTDPATTVNLQAPATLEIGVLYPITYELSRPQGSFTATLTFNFYNTSDVLVHSEMTQVNFIAPITTGTYNVTTTSLPKGFYRLEAIFNVYDICNSLADIYIDNTIMALSPGDSPCIVWPGDVNNDGIVNYGDQKSLTGYIRDANLSSIWLTGPARFNVSGDNLAWKGHPAIPWSTPDGCYMDTDGNGVINSYDYIAMKMNWMRTHGVSIPKPTNQSTPDSPLISSFPNPFSPSTTIVYTVPNEGYAKIIIYDAKGSEVETILNSKYKEGKHRIVFDKRALPSGMYYARLFVNSEYLAETKLVITR